METSAASSILPEHHCSSRRRRRHRRQKKPVAEVKAHCPEIEVPMQSANSRHWTRNHPKDQDSITQVVQCLEYTTVTHPLSLDRKRRRNHEKQIPVGPISPCSDNQAAILHFTSSLPVQHDNNYGRKTSEELMAPAKAAAWAHRLPGPCRTDYPLNIKERSEPATLNTLPTTPSPLSSSIPPPTAGRISNHKSRTEDAHACLDTFPSYCVLPDMESGSQPMSFDTAFSDTWRPNAEATCKSRELSSKEHRFVENIRTGVVDYRFQSLSHFSLHIDVRPSECVHSTEAQVADDFKMKIIFQNYSNTIPRMCRPNRQAGRGRGHNGVQVHEGSNWTSLRESLEHHFPANSVDVSTEQMQEWWGSNGKSFNWAGLPTELKEIVIQYCMCQPFNYGDYSYSLKGLQLLKSNNPGPSEIIGQLGDWGHLLGVSAELRKLTLQLCFRGGWLYPQGLSIMVNSHRHLQKSIRRLGSYYQIFDCDSIPKATDHKAKFLAHQYKYFPKIYPELKCYGTFMHGIRKVYLEFDFWSSLHFFKVSVFGFDKYRPKNFMTCDVLERLPELSSIYFYLPTKDRPRNDPMLYGPRLFHPNKACPRSLHRLIYEQAAKELASYQGVHMNMFMDQVEEERFLRLHAAAKSTLQFSEEELIQLWEDDNGGIQLDLDLNSITKLDDLDQIKSVHEHDKELDGAGYITLTPQCRCKDPCREAFAYAGKY